MTTLDFGCGMGHFSLPLARMVGPGGRVVCVDIQPKMLANLERRARKAGLLGRLELRRASEGDFGLQGLAGQVDFAVAFAVVHEVPDEGRLFRDLAAVLKPGARLFLAEPIFHVRGKGFAEELGWAQDAGLGVIERPAVKRAHAAVLAVGRCASRT
jgi:SAM-dependent methyltransferase